MVESERPLRLVRKEPKAVLCCGALRWRGARRRLCRCGIAARVCRGCFRHHRIGVRHAGAGCVTRCIRRLCGRWLTCGSVVGRVLRLGRGSVQGRGRCGRRGGRRRLLSTRNQRAQASGQQSLNDRTQRSSRAMTHEQCSLAAACAGQRRCSPSASRSLRHEGWVRQQARLEHHRASTKSTVEDCVMVAPLLVAVPVTVTV